MSSGPYNLKRVRKSPISGCFSWVIEGKRRLGWELPKLYVTIAYGVTALCQINIYGEKLITKKKNNNKILDCIYLLLAKANINNTYNLPINISVAEYFLPLIFTDTVLITLASWSIVFRSTKLYLRSSIKNKTQWSLSSKSEIKQNC